MTKNLLIRLLNRWLHLFARNVPGSTTVRPMLHRWRGVRVAQGVLIGDGVYLDNEYPECIEIGENVQISVRAVVLAHTRGPGRVIIEKNAFVGPNTTLICGGGRTLRIGEGSVVGAGCVVTKSVPPRIMLSARVPQPVARVGMPLPLVTTMDQFWAGLSALPEKKAAPAERGRPVNSDG